VILCGSFYIVLKTDGLRKEIYQADDLCLVQELQSGQNLERAVLAVLD